MNDRDTYLIGTFRFDVAFDTIKWSATEYETREAARADLQQRLEQNRGLVGRIKHISIRVETEEIA